jgi:hypothetical protein
MNRKAVRLQTTTELNSELDIHYLKPVFVNTVIADHLPPQRGID